MESTTKRGLIAVTTLLALLILAGAYFTHFVFRPGSTPSAPLISVGVAPTPPPELLNLLPPGAAAIAFADVAALRSSAFIADLDSIAPPPNEEKDYRDFVRATGFDYSRDLNRVAADFWIDSSKPLPNGSPRVSLLAVADGKFDHDKIASYALRKGTVEKHGGTDVYKLASGVPSEQISFAFLAPDRIALAQEVSLDPILSQSRSASLDPSVRERISRVNGATLFAVARTDDLPKAIAIQGLQSGQLNRVLKSIRGLSLAGQPEGNKLTVALEANCDSTPDALQLTALLETMRWLGRAALADPKTRSQMRPGDATALDKLLQIAKVNRDGNVVRVRADIPSDIVKPVPRPDATKP